MARSTRDVFDDHLQKAVDGALEADLAANYAPDVVFLTGRGTYRGHEGARRLYRMLEAELPDARFDYATRLVEGDVAFLEWTGRGGGRRVDDGADSFLVRGGRVVAQTIHYTVRDDTPDPSPPS